MKFAKHLLALAVIGAAVSAQAASDINTVSATTQTASVNLNFRITVPRIIFLSVGTGAFFTDTPTVDFVDFTLTAAQVATPGNVLGVSTATGGVVNARVFGNGGHINLTAFGPAAGLTATGLPAVPWSEINFSSSNAALNHPAIGLGAAGALTLLAATGGVVNQSAAWTFNYANAAPIAAGIYNAQVTYTAVMP